MLATQHQRIPAQSRVAIVVFAMDGCGACEEYVPRFKAIAAKYASCIPVVYADAANPKHQALADKIGVQFTPTTAVMRRGTGIVKKDSAISDAEIEELFQLAMRHAACEVA